jgi:hypothetical protein
LPLRQPDGSISHYVAIKDDITDKKPPLRPFAKAS